MKLGRLLAFTAVSLVFFGAIAMLPAKTTPEPAAVRANTASTPHLPTVGAIEAGVNGVRAEHGLAALHDNPALDAAAQERTETMCATNNWSHQHDWEVLGKYFDLSLNYAGENIYYGVYSNENAVVVVQDWTASPEHYKNMVSTNYSQIGVSIKLCPSYQGKTNQVIITNYYASEE